MMRTCRISKTLAVLLLLLFVLNPSYASDLKMEGTGASVEDARTDARSNLSEYINGVFVQSSTFTSSYDDSVSSSDTLSTSSSTTSNGYLKSVEYTNEYRKGAEYYSTAVIKDNDANLAALKDSLKTSKTTIETLYGKLSKQTGEQKKNSLITIYATLTEYEAYRTILIYMGHSDMVPELSVNVTTTSVFIEYQNVVIEEGYALEEREKLITDETEHQKLLEELSANRTEQRRLEKEKNEAAAAREEAARQALCERLKQYEAITHNQASITAKTDLERYNSLRENITSARSNFLNACTEYDNLCKEQFALVDKDYEAEKAAVKARPYRYAELNGKNPTPVAKQVREDEIDYLYIQKELHKVEIFKQIRSALVPQIKERYNLYCDAVDAIDGEKFEIVLTDDLIDKVTTSFDSLSVTWTINIKVKNIASISALTSGYSFTLSYKQLTGKDVKEPKYRGQKGYDEYMEYLDDIDYLDSVIRSFSKSFRITMSFKVEAKKAEIGIGYSGFRLSLIEFVLESNALDADSSWTLVVTGSTSSIVSQVLAWELPGYAKTFDFEFTSASAVDYSEEVGSLVYNLTFQKMVDRDIYRHLMQKNTSDFDSLGYDITAGDTVFYAIALKFGEGFSYKVFRLLKYVGYKVDESLIDEKEEKYDEAMVLYNSGKYTEAYKLFTSNSDHLKSAEIAEEMIATGKVFKVGDIGPAGGYIFYVKGSYSDGWCFLEAAPNDLGDTAYEYSYAVKACSDYTYNGYDDWFLPNKDELNLMYLNLHKEGIGNFKDVPYWANSGTDDNSAFWQHFYSGYQSSAYTGNPCCVRPARRF